MSNIQPPASQQTQYAKIGNYVAFIRSFGYDFKFNEITDRVECNGIPLTDELFNKIEFMLIEKGLSNERYTRVAINSTAYDNRYNPIKDYFAKLPYDGGNYFDQLVSCFDNPDHLFSVYLRKWMLGSVAKINQGTQNPMLVMDGLQDIGKSLFVNWLCSGLPEYFTEGSIDTENKDTQIRLTSKWIWEVGEFGHTARKADREALKNIITQKTMSFRNPYGRYDKTKPILASFIATINDEGGFLNDPTGSRRFMVCTINKIDWKRYEQIDVNKLWGEIYAAYLIGEDSGLTATQKKKKEENNKKYEIDDPIENILKDKFVIKPGDLNLWTSTANLIYVLNEKGIRFGTIIATQMALSSTCKKLGLEKAQQNNQKGYYGISPKLP